MKIIVLTDFSSTLFVHSFKMEGLLSRLRAGRVQGTERYYIRRHLQQCSPSHIASPQSWIQCRLSARPALSSKAAWRAEQVQSRPEKHSGGHRCSL